MNCAYYQQDLSTYNIALGIKLRLGFVLVLSWPRPRARFSLAWPSLARAGLGVVPMVMGQLLLIEQHDP